MRLLEIRQYYQQTQAEFAKLLGIPLRTYSGYETETRKPTPEMLVHMANCFNVSTDYLLERVDDELLISATTAPFKPAHKSEIQELYDQLTPRQQDILINTARELLGRNSGEARNRRA